DLLLAVTLYPAGRAPGSNEEKLYLAALELAVGQVEKVEEWLNGLNGLHEAEALRKIIATVRYQPELARRPSPQPAPLGGERESASEWLAEVYYPKSPPHTRNA